MRMRWGDLVCFLFTFICSVLGFGKRIVSGDDDDNDWSEELFANNQAVTLTVIIILVLILLTIVLWQIVSYCRNKYR